MVKNLFKEERGISLIEIIVAMTILGLFLGASFPFLMSVSSANSANVDKAAAINIIDYEYKVLKEQSSYNDICGVTDFSGYFDEDSITNGNVTGLNPNGKPNITVRCVDDNGIFKAYTTSIVKNSRTGKEILDKTFLLIVTPPTPQ